MLRTIFSLATVLLITGNLLFANSQDDSSDNIFYVQKSVKQADLNKNEYHFDIALNNNQTFKVESTLEGLLNDEIYEGMPFKLIEEKYIFLNPGFSTFTYQNPDSNIAFEGAFQSQNSHWKPNEDMEIIKVVSISSMKRGMGVTLYIASFSDGSIATSGAPINNIRENDHFFKVLPPGPRGNDPVERYASLLINVNDGRIFDRGNTSRSIPVNW